MLYEHASGYAVFKVIAQEEIGVLLPEVQESVADLSRFGKLVKLASFAPFKSGTNALDNINCISEGLYAKYSVRNAKCSVRLCDNGLKMFCLLYA